MYTVYGKPNCPYCERAKQLLDSKGLEYQYIDVVADAAQFAEMAKLVVSSTGYPPKTVPQIFSGDGGYVGGFDDLQSTFVRKAVIDDLEDFDEFTL